MNVEIKYLKTREKPVVKINGRYGRLIKDDARYVFHVGRFYVKVDKPEDKDTIVNHTKKEIEIWNKLQSTGLKVYFCPILKSGVTEKGFCWVVQPTVKMRNHRKKDWLFLNSMAKTVGVYDMDLEESAKSQWGYLEGNPVIIDYGL